MNTKAAVLYEIGKPLRIEELTLPEPERGQVLVKIAYSGICHSQLNEIHGLKGEDKYLPHTLGHEGSGVVKAVGKGVKKVRPGDRVVLTWIKGEGLDIASAVYQKSNGSKVNSGAISTFMEYAVVSENRLVKIPKKMPLREASLLGCAVPTGAGIIENTARVRPKSSVAVFGAGGIGLSAILAAKSLARAATIIAVDILDCKLKQAKDLGATETINARRHDPVAEIMRITGRNGVDYAIEAAGRREAMENAFQVIRDSKGLCVLAGNIQQGENISLDPLGLIKGKRIIGTWGGETKPDRDIPKYIDLFLSGKLKLNRLITHTCTLAGINRALRDAESGRAARVLIDTGEGGKSRD